MAKVTITYELDYYEEREQLNKLVKADKIYSALWDLDQELRGKLKYGEDAWLETGAYEYLEHLRDLIFESGILKDD